jgi:hypothetical protein
MAGAGTLDIYGSLTGKTVLMPSAMPLLPDSAPSDLPPDKTDAIASIERALSEKSLEVVQDGPHFVRVFPREARDTLTNAPLRGAELAVSKGSATNAPFPGAGVETAKGQETMPQGMIDFSSADLRKVLEIYGIMRQRTVLRPATLPAPLIRLKAQPGLSLEEGVYAVETVLALNGICMVDDGASFVQVVPLAQRAQVRTGAPKAGAGVIPAGLIDFSNADLNQVMAIYSAMRQRTILRPATLPAPTITLRSQGHLSQEEAVYAMAKVFELNGICLVDDGPKLVQVVPMGQRWAVQTHAPTPEPGAKLFDPKKVPTLGTSQSYRPLTGGERLEQEFEQLRKAFYEYLDLPDPAKRSAQRLLQLYAGLAGKTAVPSTNFYGAAVWFHVETPLTRSELLYAIETTFVLHGFAIIPVDDRRIRLGRLEEILKRVGNRLEFPQPHQ